MGMEGAMTPHPIPASVWRQDCRVAWLLAQWAWAAAEWLSQLCKKLPGGDMGTAAVRLPINSAQLGMETMSSLFGMKCCDRQCWVVVALPWWPAVFKGGLASSGPCRPPTIDSGVSFAFVTYQLHSYKMFIAVLFLLSLKRRLVSPLMLLKEQ